VISEEFGAIFVLFIVIIFLFIGYKVLNKVFSEQDEFIKLTLVGLVSLLVIQTFVHIGVNIFFILPDHSKNFIESPLRRIVEL